MMTSNFFLFFDFSFLNISRYQKQIDAIVFFLLSITKHSIWSHRNQIVREGIAFNLDCMSKKTEFNRETNCLEYTLKMCHSVNANKPLRKRGSLETELFLSQTGPQTYLKNNQVFNQKYLALNRVTPSKAKTVHKIITITNLVSPANYKLHHMLSLR